MLELNNCRLKPQSFKDRFAYKMYGFVLMAKGTCIELYSMSSTDINSWIEALKPFVILLDLK